MPRSAAAAAALLASALGGDALASCETAGNSRGCSWQDDHVETALAAGPSLSLLQFHADAKASHGRRRSEPEPAAIKVIGAGAPRTGTQSLALALRSLGYKAAHTMRGNATLMGLWAAWTLALHQGKEEEEVARLLDLAIDGLLDNGYNATTADSPVGYAYGRLLERFPEAKVVMTVHPGGPSAWVDSVGRSWYGLPCDPDGPFATACNTYKIYHDCDISYLDMPFMTDAKRAKCTSGYQSWLTQVRETVPPKKLLEFNVSQGWGPLCTFLDLASPEGIAFPQKDYTQEAETAFE